MHLPRSPLRRAATAWAAVAVTVVGVLAAPSATAAPRHHATVDPGLAAAVAAGQEATFFVVLDSRPDLSGATRQRGKARKVAAYQALRAEANRDQISLTRDLDQAKIGYESYWIANAVKVTGGRDLVERLAARPDVAALRQEQRYAIDTVAMGAVTTTETADPDWGVKDIGADQVWSQYGDRGEGIVVANIDIGRAVRPPRPGRTTTGATSATAPSTTTTTGSTRPASCPDRGTPCDNNGHGTHTMGTMVGDDGRQSVGVAPGAKWIAAKGCETNSCSDASLLASGQWMLAPTDLNGQNPRPDLRPGHRQQLLGRRRHRPATRTSSRPGSRPASSRCSPTATPATVLFDHRGARCPGPDRTGSARTTSTTAIACFSGLGPSLVDGSDQAEHRRARRQRPLRLAGRRLPVDLRYVDGHPARRRCGRPALVGGPLPRRRHRRHPGAARTTPRGTSTTPTAAAPPTTTTSGARASSTSSPPSTGPRTPRPPSPAPSPTGSPAPAWPESPSPLRARAASAP